MQFWSDLELSRRFSSSCIFSHFALCFAGGYISLWKKKTVSIILAKIWKAFVSLFSPRAILGARYQGMVYGFLLEAFFPLLSEALTLFMSALSVPVRLTPPPLPGFQVTSPQTLLIESSAGQRTLEQATVTVRNTGSTVLFFSWSRVPRGGTIVSVNGAVGEGEGSGGGPEGALTKNKAGVEAGVAGMQSEKEGIFTASNKVAAAAARHAAMQSPESRFFCSQVSLWHVFTINLLPKTQRW